MSRSTSRYAAKGGPYRYDKDSKTFQQGAWKNWGGEVHYDSTKDQFHYSTRAKAMIQSDRQHLLRTRNER